MEQQSWDIDGKDESCRSERDSGSEEGSLASELMATDWGSWPLFIQFCVTVHVNGQMDSFPVESIPNCLKDIIERCGQTMVDPAQELDSDGKFQFSRSRITGLQHCLVPASVEVNVEMYVLTWPLPSQCPFREADLPFPARATFDGDASLLAQEEEGRIDWAPLMDARVSGRLIFLTANDHDTDAALEQPAEIIRQFSEV